MKVAVCVPMQLNSHGGVETHILELARAMCELGIQVDVFAHGQGDYFPFEQFTADGYDLIHTHAGALPSKFINQRKNKSAAVKHIHTLHGVSIDYLLNCKAWLNWRCYWGMVTEGIMSVFADHVIAISDSVRQSAQKWFKLPDSKINVIYNGFWPTSESLEEKKSIRHTIRQKLGLRDNQTVILFVGRGEDRVKGTKDIKKAMKKLTRYNSDMKLLAIPGDGFADEDWIVKSGPVPHDIITDYYAAADIFVNASLNEGLPLTILEAMDAGLAIVAASVGGIPEVINDEQNGLLLNPKRTNLKDQLERLINDQMLRDKLGQQARQDCLQYCWQEIAQQTAALYERVLNQ